MQTESWRFETQMVKLHNEDEDYSNIYPNEGWNLEDYKNLFTYIGKGYLIQCYDNNAFMINEDWEGEPMWEKEEEEELDVTPCERVDGKQCYLDEETGDIYDPESQEIIDNLETTKVNYFWRLR
tara:strand:+ start:373 stop:744 length:372 start_codon:yes stop_codon:yes gene_type:complete